MKNKVLYIRESLALKIAIAFDILLTLFVEQVGYLFRMPSWHPVILITASSVTIASFKWKDEIAYFIVSSYYQTSDGLKNLFAVLSYDTKTMKYSINEIISSYKYSCAKEKQNITYKLKTACQLCSDILKRTFYDISYDTNKMLNKNINIKIQPKPKKQQKSTKVVLIPELSGPR